MTEKEIIKKIKSGELHLSNSPFQTEAICLAAIEQNGMALKYVHTQTPRIIKAALQQDPDSLQFVALYPKSWGL